MNRIYIMLAALLASCAPSINSEVSVRDRKVIDLTRQAWIELEQKDPEDCLEDVGVQLVSEDTFKYVCGTSPKLSIGCVRDRKTGSLAGGSKVLYISPETHPDSRDKVLVQLSLHALCSCTSEDYRDKTDKMRMRWGVWAIGFGNSSVEALAYKALSMSK